MLTTNRRFRLSLAALAWLFACSHSQPFTPAYTGTDQPWDPGPPARLTVNPADDGQISFTPDGAYLVYGLAYIYRREISGCIAFLPARQARDSRWLCPVVVDSYITVGYSRPALSAGGRLAFVLSESYWYGGGGPSYQAVMVSPLADLRDTAEVTYIPFSTPDSVIHMGVDRLLWLNEDTLVVQADGVSYLVDLTVRPRVFTPLGPGNPIRPEGVSVIQPGPREGTLYVRLGMDTRLFEWDVARDSLTPVFDFGDLLPKMVRVGRRDIVALTDSGLLRLRRSDGRVTQLATGGLPISELAYAPDDSDLIVAAAGDLYRLALP